MALRVATDPRIVPDEIAVDLHDWIEVLRPYELLDRQALDVLTEIDDQFDVMSGEEKAHLRTPDAFASNLEWRAQRERARTVLQLLGESRADDELIGRLIEL